MYEEKNILPQLIVITVAVLTGKQCCNQNFTVGWNGRAIFVTWSVQCVYKT